MCHISRHKLRNFTLQIFLFMPESFKFSFQSGHVFTKVITDYRSVCASNFDTPAVKYCGTGCCCWKSLFLFEYEYLSAVGRTQRSLSKTPES